MGYSPRLIHRPAAEDLLTLDVPEFPEESECVMPFVDTNTLKVVERKPGWYGRYFDSPSMTFAHYEFTKGSSVHQHFHPQEEVWDVIEGELEITVDGVARIAGPGVAAIVPPNVPHAVRAMTDGKAIVIDYPRRERE